MFRSNFGRVLLDSGNRSRAGSFNFTRTAEEKNAENLLVIDSPTLAAKYVANFAVHRKHSKAPN